ncbi:hypothetical protein BGY98DRAFT_982901 [Russula aff. rugulosa BPL654]|nr:hypothetical protein BGY98DRAFT_982901 [Russula aff. rugulosa BPL654]
MRASHVALLSLAASTAAPVFAAPIPHLNARSNDGGAGLSARDSRDGVSETHIPQSRDDNPKRIATREAVHDFTKKIASVKTRGSDVQQEAHASSGDVRARSFRHKALDIGLGLLVLAPRSRGNFPNTVMNRDSNHEQQMQARDELDNLIRVLSSSRRDAAPGGTPPYVDDIIDAYKSKHPARKPSQQEAQARDDDSATNAVLTALLQSRDMSRRLTTNELLRIFASRTLDDLD